MTQATLVSLYGKKEPDFASFVTDCQAMVADALGDVFHPYAMEQIHATVVGLEHRPGAAGQNRNFWQYQQREVEMDIDGYLDFLHACLQLPFDVQIGGFQQQDYPFTSDPFQRGGEVRPFERSFVIWRDKVVVMGWPVASTENGVSYPMPLDEVRRAAQRFGILHGYHRTETAVDNDLYFRVGLIDPGIAPPPSLVDEVRQMLSTRQPLILPISLDDLAVAVYEDEMLSPSTTRLKRVKINGQL